MNDHEAGEETDAMLTKVEKSPDDLLYAVDDVPPWYLCIFLGFQQYLTAFSAIFGVPMLLAPAMCLDKDYLSISQIVSTIFFVSGICTLLQSTFGTRLPIIQGGTFSFVAPTLAILALPKWCCPFEDVNMCGWNATDLPEVGGEEHRMLWQARMREIQGSIMVSSLFQIVIGFSGVVGFVLRYIGPLAVVPTVTLIGLSLFGAANGNASDCWWIAMLTVVLITLFSQYLGNVKIPFPTSFQGKECKTQRLRIFNLFPILLGLLLSWLVCYILTIMDVFPNDSEAWGYKARTDARLDALRSAQWFRIPYPGQWGVPTVSTTAVFGMLAGVLASMVESVGDYYACARLSGAIPPPEHAINRGIGIEGIGCLLAGAWGTGNGTTSYSQNIGAICITKVGSRRVAQVCGILMLVLACLGKFGALFVTIPTPVVGGMFLVVFGMIASVGLSNLQFVDLNSSRNLFILGFSLFVGISLPIWMSANPGAIQTGSDMADQILTVLCSTSMFVGGFLGFFLDNTIPGTDEERGLRKWRELLRLDNDGQHHVSGTYEFPFAQEYLNRMKWPGYLPFCPNFQGFASCCGCRREESKFYEIAQLE